MTKETLVTAPSHRRMLEHVATFRALDCPKAAAEVQAYIAAAEHTDRVLFGSAAANERLRDCIRRLESDVLAACAERDELKAKLDSLREHAPHIVEVLNDANIDGCTKCEAAAKAIAEALADEQRRKG